MTTSDNFSYFVSHLMCFRDHVTTFLKTGKDPWMTLSTLDDNLLMTLTTIVMTSLMTLMPTVDYLLTTCNDDTDDPCDDFDS
jgi:hypothetical protein